MKAFFTALLNLFRAKPAAAAIPIKISSSSDKPVTGISKTGKKLSSSSRARAAIAAALIAAGSAIGFSASQPPAAVILATDVLIKPWEGLVLKSHWDKFGKRWDICYGETKGITAGMTKTVAECEAMLRKRVYNDFYLPLVEQIPGFVKFPISLQAAMISGAYNFGVGSYRNKKGMAGSSAVRFAVEGKFREACEAQTAFNRAGGGVVEGLVKRREMGDKQRIGEAETCLSGL